MFQFIRTNQLNIMLLLCGACSILILLLLMTRFLDIRRKKILVFMEIIAVFLLWFDREAYVYSGNVSELGYVMVRVSNFMVFFLTPATVFGFNRFLSDYLTHEGKMQRPPMRLSITESVSVIGMLLAVFSAFTGLYYYFDEVNKYHRGQGFLIAYIIPVACPLIQYTVIRQYRKIFSRLIYISLVLYIFVPLACGIIQVFAYGISIVNMAMVAVSIGLYIFTYMDINDTVEHAHRIEIENMQGEKLRMQKLFDQTALSFVSAMEKKDDYIKGNAVKVADYAKRIAELKGKTPEECEKVYYAALLHDVGIIGIPDSVIQAESNTDTENRDEMRKKPLIGSEILSSITEYPYLGIGARYSHERYNGSGYPEGLKGEEIPEIARIIGVADAYVLMSSQKRFRDAKPDFMVREALVRGAGVEFDPEYAELLLKIVDAERNTKTAKEVDEIESTVTCNEYREHVTAGVVLDEKIKCIAFKFYPLEGVNPEFSAPSVVLFDSYDGHIHTNEKSIEAYRYSEYGELWFDGHSICASARRILEAKSIKKDVPALSEDGSEYEILAGRYEDHLKLILNGPVYKKEFIVALPGGSKSAYLSLTGEQCCLKDIVVEPIGKNVSKDDITRIAEEISYIDRMESDLKNIQIDRPRSAYTDGVEIKERLKLKFHTMSLPGESLVWHCPYILIYQSSDGKVGGEDYKEYSVIKLYGENDGDNDYAVNNIVVKKTDDFKGWDLWKEVNKKGLECSISIKKKDDRITLKTYNLGIEIENITTLKDNKGKVYVALTGDQVALTDIRIR